MAATATASRLTEAYRLAQARLGADAVRSMLDTWRLLDPSDIDGTLESWLRVATSLVQAQRRTSTRMALDYLRTFRVLELGSLADFTPHAAPSADPVALTTSLTVTGPAHVKAAMTRGVPLALAARSAQSTVARSAHRHVLDGGRSTIAETLRNDPRSLGYARSTSGQCCAFCAMLASRGAAYGSEGTADFQPHDGCACTPEPIYRRDAALPPGTQRFQQTWTDAQTLARSEGVTESVAFRRLIEGRA